MMRERAEQHPYVLAIQGNPRTVLNFLSMQNRETPIEQYSKEVLRLIIETREIIQRTIVSNNRICQMIY